MKISTKVNKKIEKYDVKGGLDHTARLVLSLCNINHENVKGHIERVALLAEAVAIKAKKDAKAAFFGGLLHDIGKLVLPSDLFDGHNIDAGEYIHVKTHALAGFEALKDHHAFTALCAGFHHALYKAGYGLTVSDFPDWNPATIKKVLEISSIISICDFVDAFTHRETKIKDSSNASSTNLKEILRGKYPDDHQIIDITLSEIKTIIKGGKQDVAKTNHQGGKQCLK